MQVGEVGKESGRTWNEGAESEFRTFDFDLFLEEVREGTEGVRTTGTRAEV